MASEKARKKRRAHMLRTLSSTGVKLKRGEKDSVIAKHYEVQTGNRPPSVSAFETRKRR